MTFNTPTLATIFLVSIGTLMAAPVLAKGFKRRGSGVKYERNFLIQRAPQLASCLNIGLLVLSFMTFNDIAWHSEGLLNILSAGSLLPADWRPIISWIGVALLLSGLVFMIGGWYSLGEMFSTDAEVMDKHTVKRDGLLSFVMHPAYSGIIQSLLGASVASLSPLCVLVTLLVVAPLWLNRAKYEEAILLESLGPSYKQYAEDLKWRRLVPWFIPIGV